MDLDYLATLPESFDGSSIFAFVHSDDLKSKATLPQFVEEDFKGKNGSSIILYEPSVAHLHHPSCGRIALIGTDIQEGCETPVNKEKLRSAVCSAIKLAKRQRWSRLLFMLPPNKDAATMLHEAAIVSMLADFDLLDAHVTMEERKPFHVKNVQFSVQSPFADGGDSDARIDIEEAKNAIEAGKRVGMSCLYSREIANGRGDDANPAYFEEECQRLSKKYESLRVQVVDFEAMKEKGLGLIAAVGQGATVPPRIIFLEYNGNPLSEEKIAIVGKGVTFDSGGLHLKPSAFIDNMHLDKHGAATVMGVMKWIGQTNPSLNVLGVLALAENAIDAKAFKPQAILKSYKGITVEVGNTDAEGRLCLADAMSYAQKNFNGITHMIDIATLTGACVVALGEQVAGIFSNDDEMASELIESGKTGCELLWRLPLFDHFREELSSREADIKSTGNSRYGGASIAAAFLSYFVDDGIKWSHLDIAGPGMLSSESGYRNMRGSGFGVETVSNYLKMMEKKLH